MRDCLDDIINENCLLTIAEMNRELRLRLPHKPIIHDRTVARALEGILYRVKLARPLPADRNRPDVVQKRVEYGNWFMGYAVVNHTVFTPFAVHYEKIRIHLRELTTNSAKMHS